MNLKELHMSVWKRCSTYLSKHKHLKNAEKYFKLTPLQKDIISKHMFPVTFTPPKYKESLLVSLIDKYSSINERTYSSIRNIKELPIIKDIIYQTR